jgi:hypothetical protein
MMPLYEIDAFEGSGKFAVLALGMLAMARRCTHPDQADTLHSLVTEIDAFSAQENRPMSFGNYFLNKRSQLRINSAAAAIFCRYLVSQLKILPEMFKSNDTDLAVKIQKIMTGNITRLIDLVVTDFARSKAHPTFSWVSSKSPYAYGALAFSEQSLRLCLVGLSQRAFEARDRHGVYYIIREARGMFLRRPPDRLTIIAKDLLWLRRPDMLTPHQPQEWCGAYFSSMDNAIYTLSDVQIIDNSQVQCFGRKMGPEGHLEKHHFYFAMPEYSDEPFRIGLICGSTSKAQRPAAWKVAVIEPPDRASIAGDLEAIVHQEYISKNRSDHQVSKQSSAGARYLAGLDFLQQAGRIGILASHALASASGNDLATLQRSHLIIRTLGATEGVPQIDPIILSLFENLLSKRAVGALDRLRSMAEAKDLANDLIRGILESWAMLEPDHLFARNPSAGTASEEILKMVAELLAQKPSAPDLDTMIKHLKL